VHSDSSYVIDAFNKGWIDNWQKNGWKTADKKPVENQDLWRLLLLTTKKHEVSFHKVPGHADHPENNRCDELAKMEVQTLIKSLIPESDTAVNPEKPAKGKDKL
jgi:ribonuclease HI